MQPQSWKTPPKRPRRCFRRAKLVGPPGWQPLLQLRPRFSPPGGREGGFSQLLHAAGEGLFARGMGGNQIPCTGAGRTERRGRPPRRAGRGGGGGPPPARCRGAGPRHLPTATSVGCFLADSPPNPRLPSNKSPRHRRGVCRCLVCLYWGSLNPELVGSVPRVPVDLGKGWSRRAPSCHPAAPCPGESWGGLRPGQSRGGWSRNESGCYLPALPGAPEQRRPASAFVLNKAFFFRGSQLRRGHSPRRPESPHLSPASPAAPTRGCGSRGEGMGLG